MGRYIHPLVSTGVIARFGVYTSNKKVFKTRELSRRQLWPKARLLSHPLNVIPPFLNNCLDPSIQDCFEHILPALFLARDELRVES